VNATIVPFLVAPGPEERRMAEAADELARATAGVVPSPSRPARSAPVTVRQVGGTTPVAALEWRQPARVAGRVRAMRVQPLGGVPSLECTVVDSSGEALLVVFLGRRSIAGVRTGSQLLVEGMVGKHHGKLAMINPIYELLGPPEAVPAEA
jgi:hypothetical protein